MESEGGSHEFEMGDATEEEQPFLESEDEREIEGLDEIQKSLFPRAKQQHVLVDLSDSLLVPPSPLFPGSPQRPALKWRPAARAADPQPPARSPSSSSSSSSASQSKPKARAGSGSGSRPRTKSKSPSPRRSPPRPPFSFFDSDHHNESMAHFLSLDFKHLSASALIGLIQHILQALSQEFSYNRSSVQHDKILDHTYKFLILFQRFLQDKDKDQHSSSFPAHLSQRFRALRADLAPDPLLLEISRLRQWAAWFHFISVSEKDVDKMFSEL